MRLAILAWNLTRIIRVFVCVSTSTSYGEWYTRWNFQITNAETKCCWAKFCRRCSIRIQPSNSVRVYIFQRNCFPLCLNLIYSLYIPQWKTVYLRKIHKTLMHAFQPPLSFYCPPLLSFPHYLLYYFLYLIIFFWIDMFLFYEDDIHH